MKRGKNRDRDSAWHVVVLSETQYPPPRGGPSFCISDLPGDADLPGASCFGGPMHVSPSHPHVQSVRRVAAPHVLGLLFSFLHPMHGSLS